MAKKGTGMTLYERIMVYRKLKEGDEGNQSNGTSPNDSGHPAERSSPGQQQQQQQQQQQLKSQQRRESSSQSSPRSNNSSQCRQREEERKGSGNNHSAASQGYSHHQEQQQLNQRGSNSRQTVHHQSYGTSSSNQNSNNGSSSSMKKLERSDSSFGSVDLSELTGLAGEEEKNRSPTPLPTFDDPPRADKTDRQSHHAHEEHTATRELQVQKEEQVINRRTSSAMADSAAVSMATVVMATRAQSSTAERREVRKANKEDRRGSHSLDKDQHEHNHKETRAPHSEEKRDIRRSEVSQKEATAPAAASAAAKPKSSSEFPAKIEEGEYKQTIDALDKLAEKNLQRLLGEGEGKGEEMSEMDRKLLEKVFSAKFQAELDHFLRTT